MKWKRAVAALMTAALAAGLVAGCGSSSSGGDSGDSGSSGDKKEVVIWDYFETEAQQQMMQDLIDGFNESQDEYVASHTYVPFADYEKQLTLGLSSGDLPDLVIMDG